MHVQLKPGMFGVKVRIIPPDALFPDKMKIAESLPPEEEDSTLQEGKPETEEAPVVEEAKEEAAGASQEVATKEEAQTAEEATEQVTDEKEEAKE